jgi:hypothetical protein
MVLIILAMVYSVILDFLKVSGACVVNSYISFQRSTRKVMERRPDLSGLVAERRRTKLREISPRMSSLLLFLIVS